MVTLYSLKEEAMDLFHGLMYGTVQYSYDNLHSTMKTDICEVYSSIAEDFVMSVETGKDVTREQLQELYDNLVAFGEEFQVEEAMSLAGKVKERIDHTSEINV